MIAYNTIHNPTLWYMRWDNENKASPITFNKSKERKGQRY